MFNLVIEKGVLDGEPHENPFPITTFRLADRLSRLHRDNFNVVQAEAAQGILQLGRCSDQDWECAVVHGNDVLDAEHAHGNGGLAWAHCVEVPDGQHGYVGLVQFADELHVAEGAGVTGMIDFEAVLKFEDEASGLAAIGSVLGARGVDGVGHGELDALGTGGTPLVHADGVLDTLGAEPASQFHDGNAGWICGLCNARGVANVVAVAVCDEHQIDLVDLLEILGAGGIVLRPGVDQDDLALW